MNFILLNLSLFPVPCFYNNWKASSSASFCVCLHLQKTLLEKVQSFCALVTLPYLFVLLLTVKAAFKIQQCFKIMLPKEHEQQILVINLEID